MRPARVVKNGREISIEALSGQELVDIPGLEKLESFYTDGSARSVYECCCLQAPVAGSTQGDRRYSPGEAWNKQRIVHSSYF